MGRKKQLRGPAATGGGTLLGLSPGLVLAGVAAAVGLAYLNAGSGNEPAAQTPAPSPGAGNSTTTTPQPATGPGPKPGPPASNAASGVKPVRKPLVKGASPLLYVFVDSLGGEGIFDRLKFTRSALDGNGLNRIVTLGNHEFAGWATGVTWRSSSGELYIQLYQTVGEIGYNYWIEASQTKQVHSTAAYQGYGWQDFKQMSDSSKASIAQFYFATYQIS